MTEQQAKTLAELLNGKVWRPHWGVYLVMIERADHHLIVINDQSLCEYKNRADLFENNPKSLIWFE